MTSTNQSKTFEVQNVITLDRDNIGSFFGPIAGIYSYTPKLRARLDEVFAAAMRSANRFFVLESDIVRAASHTGRGARRFMNNERVLVIVVL